MEPREGEVEGGGEREGRKEGGKEGGREDLYLVFFIGAHDFPHVRGELV